MPISREQTVDLLARVAEGDAEAADRLYPHIASQLRGLAQRLLGDERAAHTLQPTALVDDAFVELVGDGVQVSGKRHFVDLAARAMRRVLVDHARKRQAAKRGVGAEKVTLSGVGELLVDTHVDVLALEEALEELASHDARKAQVVELRFYGGMTVSEVASCLEISPKTAEADWYMARAWLKRALSS